MNAQAEEVEIDRQRVAMLFARAPVALLTVVVNAGLLGWLMWGHAPTDLVLAWVGALWTVSLGRAWLVLSHRRRPDARSSVAWERAFAVGAALNGVVWGLGGFAFTGPDVITTLAVLLVMGGMVAGASSSTSISMLSFAMYAVPALLPVVVALGLTGTALAWVMAVMLVLFGGAMGVLARQGGRAIISSWRLERHNAILVEQLRLASQQRSSRMRLLLEQAGVAVLVAEPTTLTILEVSDNASSLLGTETGPLVGTTLDRIAPLAARADTASWALTATRARTSEQILGGITGQPRPDGTIADLEMSLVVRAIDGKDHLLAVLKDVAERKALEAALLQSSVLASLGTLAAGVAHEVNNPLGYILGNLHTLREHVPPVADQLPTDTLESIDECIVGAQRIRRIVEDLTSTARSAAPGGHGGKADIEAILDSCLKVADAEIRYRARVVRSREQLPTVPVDPIRLNQVFLNLLLNAAQAIPEGDADANRITVRTSFDPKRQRVRVAVTDTGCGIEAELLPRIFEPFFTTKAPGKGTGLGLSICHALVTGSGGTLTATSVVGEGTTMQIEIPVEAQAEPDAPTVVVAPPRPPRPLSCRVLVVDDEPFVRRSVERLLREHEVVTVSDGAQAIETLDAGPGFDLILCDLMMAGMTGMELHEQLQRRSPDDAERMVFMTGGAFTERSRRFLERVSNHCIGKPFDVDALRELATTMASSRDGDSAAGSPVIPSPRVGSGGTRTPPPS
ncbi:MAG: response regulator [Deltaproteobacteria bacterium]|nr:response regulator [Deltaproteobacteria bacterium]